MKCNWHGDRVLVRVVVGDDDVGRIRARSQTCGVESYSHVLAVARGHSAGGRSF